MVQMNIDQIQVGFRYRKDLGDLRSLADSIAEVGLLHPVVVTPEGRLIAGQRRLEACRALGWTEVPVTVVDLYQAARGEAHENFVRKDLLPSEIVALKRAIEPLERREARERQGHKADLCHPATVAEGQGAAPGDTRDKIARYLGIGRTTIERAEAVVDAAEEEPEEYGYLVEQMDRSGKVAGAYRRLEVLRQAKELDAAPPALPTGPFQVIVADPPWRYESGNSLPYPTMDIEEIKAMPVAEIADENAILWLWTTNAHLRVAFDVVEAWGFEYRTSADLGQRPDGHRRMAARADRALHAGRPGQAGVPARQSRHRPRSRAARAFAEAGGILRARRSDMPGQQGRAVL